ncbi:MAG: RsmE family RNA methyltransferase [Ignavibacteria bacterium]
MEYYFTKKENVFDNKLVITGQEAKHLQMVLRKKMGDQIYVTDGEKNLYKTEIKNISKDSIKCGIIEKYYNVNEPSSKIVLFQSLLKNPSRFEFVIEKTTELGVYEIIPILTENVINKSCSKLERWQSIALSAMKQSQRCYLPKVNNPVNFAEAIKLCSKFDLNLIADERVWDSKIKISDLRLLLKDKNSCALFIGPEGGFAKNEIETAAKNEFKILNLGKRKLRSETASITAIGLLLNAY